MGAQVAQGCAFPIEAFATALPLSNYPIMGACASGDHEMMGHWSIDSDNFWSGTLHVLEGTEEHFEGDYTGTLSHFKASGGKWSATVLFDDLVNEDDIWNLKGTYKDDTAKCTLAVGPNNVNVTPETWTLKKTGEAY